VHQEGRPDQGLEEAQYASPKGGGVADVIDGGADETEAIDATGGFILHTFIFY